MTKAIALETLKNSHLVAPWTNDQGEIWNFQIGELFAETQECFIFVVYPHSTKAPIDPDYAFLFDVMKDNSAVVRSDSPVTEDELREAKKNL